MVLPGAPAMATTAAMPQMAAPSAPPKLTQGMPNPDQITHQKAAYAKALDKQLEQAKQTVTSETQMEKKMAEFTAAKQIQMFNIQMQEKMTEAIAQVEEVATIQLLELKKAHKERNMQLENQALGLTNDYQVKALMAQCAQAQYKFQQQYMAAEAQLAQQYQAVQAKAMTGTPIVMAAKQ
jgi:hypothetical protein